MFYIPLRVALTKTSEHRALGAHGDFTCASPVRTVLYGHGLMRSYADIMASPARFYDPLPVFLAVRRSAHTLRVATATTVSQRRVDKNFWSQRYVMSWLYAQSSTAAI